MDVDVVLKRYFWTLDVLAIALCAILAGRAVAHLIEQNWLIGDGGDQPGGAGTARRAPPAPAPEKAHSKDPETIIKRNVFCSNCAPFVEPEAQQESQSDALTKSSLPLELVSTMWVPGSPQWSMAVIRDTASKGKDSYMYNAGKMIMGTQAEVLRVDPKKVYLRNNNHFEYLELEGAEKREAPKGIISEPIANPGGGDPMDTAVASGVRCSGSACEVDRPLLDKLLNNTTSLATAARFVPSVKDGRPNGFKLYAIRPTSIFGKIGLQNGDTIKSINGMEMSSPDQALGVYSKLRSASHLTVSLDRRGESVTLDYTIR